MDDLLGIEIDYLPDGGIKLHQTAYVNKVVNRFMPDGPLSKCQRGSSLSPPSLEVASKKRAMDDVLHGKAIIMTCHSPARASASKRAYFSSLSTLCAQPPPSSPSLSIWSTSQPVVRIAAVKPSARAYGPE